MSSTTTTQEPTDTEWLDQHQLNDRQRLFVLSYIKSGNGRQSAIEAGYSEASAEQQASRLLTNAKVKAAIAYGRQQLEKAVMLDAEGIARMWADIATADPGELVQNIHGACRYCYGAGHDYQWRTEREYREALQEQVWELYAEDDLREAAMSGAIEDPRLPNDNGGYGYRLTVAPNPDCPECDGLGIEITRMADTRDLRGTARLLYDGVEETRQGKKIKMQDRAKALENLAKHLGMFAGKVEAETTSPLERLAQRLMSGAQQVPVTSDPQPEQPAPAAQSAAPSSPETEDGEIEP